MEFKRAPQKLLTTGLDLNHPVDLLPPGKFPSGLNIRSYQEGFVQPRTGFNKFATVGSNTRTIARMNDYVFSEFVRFLGTGTTPSSGVLYADQNGANSFAYSDTGYSGNPLSIVPYRPFQSPRVYAYIADNLRMRKLNTDLGNFPIGVAPPNIIPHAELTAPQYIAPGLFDSASGWNGQNMTTPTLQNRIPGPVTIGTILYISGSTGWAGIIPSGGNPDSLNAGMRLIVDSGGGNAETTTVEEIHQVFIPAGSPTMQIAGILYDSGTSGACTIQPSQQLSGLARNTLIELNSEWVRVTSVTAATTGVPNASFRCVTTGTHSAGETITVPTRGNMWVYLTNTHSAGEVLTGTFLNTQTTGLSKGGQAFIWNNSIASSPVNLGNINGIPLQPDDYIHFSLIMDHPEYLVEGQLILDVDPNTTTSFSNADGNSNAYRFSFRANDLQPTILMSQTTDATRTQALQLSTQNEADLAFITSVNGAAASDLQQGSTQMAVGQTMWTEFIVKISDLTRVGSTQTTDLSQVRAVQFRFTVSNNIVVSVGNLWVGGTFGPDSYPNLQPFVYRHRYRSSTTGARSLPGPMMRTGIRSRRQAISISFQASSDAQVDKIDIERFGGSNGGDWHYVQTIPNTSPTFVDNLESAAIVVDPPLDEDTFQPFPITDVPRKSVINVVGTAIQWVSGDTFNLNWSRGTEVIINGDVTTLYATPASTTLMHVDSSMDLGGTQTLEIQEATIAGQPLPVMWGPYYDTMFATGNVNDVGLVFYTKNGDPDSAPDTNYIEVTSPSEAMMNGVMYDGRSYAFSDRRLFGVLPTNSQVPGEAFSFTEVRNGKGLIQRWAFCVGPKIWFVSSDGVYETDGSEPVRISDDIKAIFPKADSPGEPYNGFNPIDTTQLILLAYHNNFLFMDYTDTSGNPRTMAYDTIARGWYPDEYFVNTSPGVTCHYSEVFISGGIETRNLLLGTSDGRFGIASGASDDGLPIVASLSTQAFNAGDTRAKKLFGDAVFDLDPQGIAIDVQAFADNYASALPTVGYINAGRFITNPMEFNSGLGQFARNLAMVFSWSSNSAVPKLYFWEPSFVERPEDTFLRATDWTDDGYKGSKFLQGFRATADTGGVTRSVIIRGDQRDLQTFSMNHNGELTLPYSLNPPQIAAMFQVSPQDEDFWRLFGIEWIWEPAPDLATNWQTQGTTHDLPGYQFIKDGYIAHISTAQLTLNINIDGTIFSFNIPSSGGNFVKSYLVFNAMGSGKMPKGKLFTYQVVSSQPFRLFKKDCEINVHLWGGGQYITKRPFGDLSNISGARI